MKKIVLAVLFVIGAVAVTTKTVRATDVIAEQHQSQEASQEAESTCSGGSYGQEWNCHLKTTQNVKQEQSQKVLGAQDVIGRRGRVHVPADTAMDSRMAAAVMGATVIGVLAYLAKRSIA